MPERSYRKDVSDAEITQHMRLPLERLALYLVPRKVSRPAPAPEPEQEPWVEADTTNKPLAAEEKEYLEHVLEHPLDNMTRRAEALGLSSYLNQKRKTSLFQKGLVEELTLNLGHATRGIIKLLRLTPAGYDVLGRKAPPQPRDNASPEHHWWQERIAEHFKTQAFRAVIEFPLNGKHADVGITKDGKNYIAVEVAMSPKNEVVNVCKDLEAGFVKVVVACRNSKVQDAVHRKLHEVLTGDQWQRVRVMLLSEFSFVKQLLTPTR